MTGASAACLSSQRFAQLLGLAREHVPDRSWYPGNIEPHRVQTVIQGGSPFGSRGTTSSGAFDISALRPATDLGLERREASAAPKKAQEGEGSEFLGAQPDGNPIFFLDT